jgi:uncharacterized protein (UPF0212 family)
VSVTGQIALCTPLGLFPTEWKNITTVAAPVGSHVRKGLESVGNAVVELGFVRIGFGVGLCDTLGNDLGIALFVAGVVAVSTLHACRVFEEIAAERAAHDVVELLLHELVAILFDDLFLALTNSSLATKTDVERLLVVSVFCYARSVLNY